MMQSNIFQTVAPLLREKQYNIDLDAFLEFMKQYRSNDWIYPDAIHRELGMDLKVIYEILETCVDNNIVEQYLNIYCPTCQRFKLKIPMSRIGALYRFESNDIKKKKGLN